MLSLIVATTYEGIIGHEGKLLWRIPTDLKFFKEKTLGHKILMGRKTFESLGKPLPGREHIVLTRDEHYAAPEGVTLIHRLEEVLPYAQEEEEVFLIGGGELFRQFMPLCQRLYITWVDQVFEGDTQFPLEKLADFTEVTSWQEVDELSGIPLTFSEYVPLNV